MGVYACMCMCALVIISLVLLYMQNTDVANAHHFVLCNDLAKPHLYTFTCMVCFCPTSLTLHPLGFVSLPLYYLWK